MSLFITFEGPDGSGKTTQIHMLKLALLDAGKPVLATREPGGTRLGNAIRNLLLDIDHTEMAARTETLLFNAARAQLVDEVIRPALAAGQVVLCDRYADSTLAYQGYGHAQSLADLQMLIDYATAGLTPDLTIYLDIEPEDGLRRKQSAETPEWNRLDAKKVAFHHKVRNGYLQLAAQEPHRWFVINAMQPVEQIHREIVSVVENRLQKKTAEGK
jgi:dTMP kinase